MRSEEEINKVLDGIKEALTQNISELDTAYYRGQFASLQWILSEDKKEEDEE